MSLSVPKGVDLSTVRKIHRKSSLFYYQESYALEAKKILDILHGQGKPIRVSVANVSANTLRLQYYHGAKYLVDYLDPDKHYAKLHKETRCVTSRDYIELHIRAPRGISVIEQVSPWKDDFIAFIETAAPNDKFFRDDVTLTEEEIAWINNQLVMLVKKDESPLFYGQIERNKILLIRDEDKSDEAGTTK